MAPNFNKHYMAPNCGDCAAREQIDHLTLLYNDRSHDVKWLRSEVEGLRRKLNTERAQQEGEKEKHNRDLERLRSEMERTLSESAKEIVEKTNLNNQLHHQMEKERAQFNAERKKLEHALQEAKQQVGRLADELHRAKAANEELKEKVRKLEFSKVDDRLTDELHRAKAENEELKVKVRKLEYSKHDENCYKYYCFNDETTIEKIDVETDLVEEKVEKPNVLPMFQNTNEEKKTIIRKEFNEHSLTEFSSLARTIEMEASRKRKHVPDEKYDQFFEEVKMRKAAEPKDERARLRLALEKAGIPEVEIDEAVNRGRDWPYLHKLERNASEKMPLVKLRSNKYV